MKKVLDFKPEDIYMITYVNVMIEIQFRCFQKYRFLCFSAKKDTNGKWTINEWDFPAADMPEQGIMKIKAEVSEATQEKLRIQIKEKNEKKKKEKERRREEKRIL